MELDPQDLTSPTAIDAGVQALAARNRAHLEGMAEEERAEAMGHWRALALDVLTAARDSLDGAPPADADGGRAFIVLEDAGGEEVTVSASFVPELDEVGDGEVSGTPAQIAALSLLEALAEGDEE